MGTTLNRSGLKWDVFVAPGIPTVTNDLPPNTPRRMFSPISSTLIYGRSDAVLVDALMTVEQARSLRAWIEAHERNLTTIYVTHGHGDHHFGASVLLERYPHARVVATTAVVEQMRRHVSPTLLETFWKSRFPAQIPERLLLAEPLTDSIFHLEGYQLVVVPLGHTDTDDTTCLHIPSIGLVVAGDAAYNDVHQYLAESTPEGRREWIAALDTIESLKPSAVIAGHKRAENDDDPRIIEETRQYICDFDRVASATKTARELYDQMLELYPKRVNPGALWISARAVKP
jgi:glyoxylase-like metal-dependent hydrolase (beta-lactamase superfamily II)